MKITLKKSAYNSTAWVLYIGGKFIGDAFNPNQLDDLKQAAEAIAGSRVVEVVADGIALASHLDLMVEINLWVEEKSKKHKK